jgi:hypothetical protein
VSVYRRRWATSLHFARNCGRPRIRPQSRTAAVLGGSGGGAATTAPGNDQEQGAERNYACHPLVSLLQFGGDFQRSDKKLGILAVARLGSAHWQCRRRQRL